MAKLKQYRNNYKEIKGWTVICDGEKKIIPAGILITHENSIVAYGPVSEFRKDITETYKLCENETTGFSFAFPCCIPNEKLSFYALIPTQRGCSLYPIQGGSIYSHTGICPVCKNKTTFSSKEYWLRDHFFCLICGSLPRIRHFLYTLDTTMPHWRTCALYEIAPDSEFISKESSNYSFSQYFPKTSEPYVKGIRNENIERLSFADNTFDIVVCSDVLEHVFNPSSAIREMCRVVKHGGKILFSTPIFPHCVKTICRAKVLPNGNVQHLLPPHYHGNPISPDGSLVTFDFGNDFKQLLSQWLTGIDYSLVHQNTVELEYGIAGDFLDLFIITKI